MLHSTDVPIPDGLTTEPTECNESNQGRCECGDPSKGITTYTFKIDDVQRCFTVYHPSTEKLPVLLSPNCYASDKLMGIRMSERATENKAAAQYGYARFGLSSPDGHWTFGNDGIVNDANPMPCSEEDSKDITYLKKVFSFIESNPEKFEET